MVGGRIDYTVGFKVDSNQLNGLKTQLQQVQTLARNALNGINPSGIVAGEKELQAAINSAQQLEVALNNAFNPKLGTLNISKFNQSLNGMDLNKVYQDMSKIGNVGTNAFRSMTSQVLSTNMQLKQSSQFLNNMATTLGNAVKWTASSAAIRAFTSSVSKAYRYVQDLDKSLNNIQIVTKQSSEDMERFAKQANKAAKELHASTTAYTQAALIYAQQGLQGQELEARTDVTMKVANVTGVDAEEASEYLTAVWNGYKVSAEETELYVDKLANVAAHTASNLEELSTGMSKVASAANIMGVDVDQLNAQLSTIISVTREAPETIGTSLKTVYARMADIEAGLDEETTLGNYTSGMAELGVNVLDAQGKLRDTGEVIEEIGGKWETMTREQQIALARTIAGQRQYSRMLSLFDNWDKYEEALEYSKNATRELQTQQDIYAESIAAQMNDLKVASEELYSTLFNPEGVNSLLGIAEGAISLFENFVESIGGGGQLLLGLGLIATQVFKGQIASSLGNVISNMVVAKNNLTEMKAVMEVTGKIQAIKDLDPRIQQLVEMKKKMLDLGQSVSEAEHAITNENIKQLEAIYKQQDAIKERKNLLNETYLMATGQKIDVANMNVNERESYKQDLKRTANVYKTAENALGNISMEKAEPGWYTSMSQQENIIKSARAQKGSITKKINSGNLDKTQIEELQKEYQKLEEKIKSANKEKEKLMKSSKDVVTQTRDTMGSLFSTGLIDGNQMKQAETAIKDYQSAVKNLEPGSNSANLATKKLVQTLQSIIGPNHAAIKNALHEMGVDFNNLEKEAGESAEAVKRNQEQIQRMAQLKAGIESVVGVFSALGQVAMSIQTLWNIGDIIKNEDLTNGEKLLQIVTNLGFALPMLVSSMASLGKIMKIDTAWTVGATAAKTAYSAATVGASGALVMLKGALLAAAAGFKAFFVAMGPIGWIISAITVLVSAVLLLKKIMGGHKTALEKATEAQENANKALKDATAKATEAQSAYDNLKSSLDKLSSSETTLSALTRGTTEWAAAVLDVNQQILTLLDLYPSLAKYISSENGRLTINEEGREEAIRLQLQEAQNEQQGYLAAQLGAQKEDYNVKKEEARVYIDSGDFVNSFTRNNRKKIRAFPEFNVAAESEADDIANGTFSQEEFIKNAILLDTDLRLKLKADETNSTIPSKEALQILTDYVMGKRDDYSGAFAEELDEIMKGVVDNSAEAMKLLSIELQKNADEVSESKIQTMQLTKELQRASFTSYSGASEEYGKLSKKDQAILDTVATNTTEYQDAYNNSSSELREAMIDAKEGSGDEEVIEQYLTEMGYDLEGKTITDDGAGFIITDKEGNETHWTNERLYAQYGMYQGNKALENEGYNNIINNARNVFGTVEGLDTLLEKGVFTGEGTLDFTKLSLNELQNVLSMENQGAFGDQIASLGGFTDGQALKNAWLAALDPETLADSFSTAAQNALNNIKIQKSASSTLSQGEELSEEELASVKNLEREYEVLGNIVELYGEKGRYSHEYLENLRKINEEQEDEALEQMLFAREQYGEELESFFEQNENGELVIKAGVDTTELDELLSKIEDNEYQLKIAVQADLESDVQNAFGIADEFENLSELISEDMKLTMKEVQSIIDKGYGAILTNATKTADGQIQLNTNVANSYIDSKQAEIAASMEQRKSELLQQRQVLVAQQTILKNKITALKTALGAQNAAEAAQHLATVQNYENEFQAKNEELQGMLINEDQAAAGKVGINEELYTALGGIYEQDTANQVDAENEAANAEAEVLNVRIANVKKLFDAYENVKQSILHPFKPSSWNVKGTKTSNTSSDSTSKDVKGDYQAGDITDANYLIKNLGLFNEDGSLANGGTEYQATINALLDQANADLTATTNNIGAIDAALAAMDSSYSNLDKVQANAGKGSKNKKELLEDELDIYHDVNREIEKLSTNLEALEKIQNRLTGKKLIQNLNEQIKLFKDQNKVYQDKLALQYAEAARYKLLLSGKGIQFDSDGDITNYNSLLQKKQDEVNQLINSGASEEEIEKAKKAYEVLKEEMEKYEELLYNEIEETKKAMQELYDQIIEMQVEKFTMDIELQTNFADIKNEWLELRDSILYSEKAFGQTAATAMSGLKDSMAGVYDTLADVEYMQGELAKIKVGQNSDLFGNNEKIANETINETIGKTQEWVQSSLDYIEAIEEAAISAMEEIIDLQSQMIDSYENLISTLEHKMSLKELIGGDAADTTEELQETFNIQLDIAKTSKKNLDENRKYLAENGEWLKENNPEEYLNYVNNVLEAEEQVFSSVEEAITTLNDLFDKGIENMLKEVETAYAGALGWEELSTRWENDQELADLYLTSVQKEYELQKMLNKVNQDILDKQYDSIYAQQKLNDFKENYIKMLEKEGDLTQAQVDRMNKMYELTLLQIALEEAKNNKSSMKLTRDSQGNYVYQYTTDEAEVAKREQELADKKNEIYKQDIEDTKSAISDYISAGKDAQSEYMDLFESEEFKRYMELSAESVGRELTPEEQAELDTAREKAYDMLAERAQTSAKQMEAQRKSTLEGINNILKDVDLQEIDWTQDYDTIVDNLDENQLDALLDAGIDLRSSAFKSLFGFNSNTYLQDILSSENGVWNDYLNAVGSYGNNLEQVLQAVGSENLDSYYDNIDLIYQEVQTIQNEISTQAEMANKEYQLTQNTLKEAERIRKELEKDFSENGRLNDIMNTQLATLEDELLEVKKELKKQTRLLDPNSEDDSEDVVTGWINNNGIWSYADSSGKSVKGWNKLDWQGKQDWYYFDENGAMKSNQWIHNASGTWSYVNGAGQAVTGWQVLDWQGKNDWYHFDEEGTMSANKWIGDYFVGSGGQMLTDIWVGHNGMYYWVGSDGKWLNLPSWTSHGRPNDGYPIYEYDTGGYTGSWFNGSRDGRLAFLHQKELVLNEKDTPRILDAVKLVREISTGSIIKGFEAQMRNTLSSLENQLIGTYANIEGMAAAAKQSTDQMLEQAVHIDASFPGVKDAREIEEALNNLVNVASQYAYENNK